MVLLSSLRLIPVLDKLRRRRTPRVRAAATCRARTLAYAAGICAVPLRFTKRASSYVGQNGMDAWAHCALSLGIVQGTKHCVRVTVANAPQCSGRGCAALTVPIILLGLRPQVSRLVVDRRARVARHRPAVRVRRADFSSSLK